MRTTLHHLLLMSLALVLSGGNTALGDLRSTLKITASSVPLPDEEDQRSKQVEEQVAATTAHRRTRLRLGTTRPWHSPPCSLVPASERCQTSTPPDSESDLRNGIGAPLRC